MSEKLPGNMSPLRTFMGKAAREDGRVEQRVREKLPRGRDTLRNMYLSRPAPHHGLG